MASSAVEAAASPSVGTIVAFEVELVITGELVAGPEVETEAEVIAELEGFHVAADGIFAFVSSSETILPSLNAASASAAACAIARARSTLNCLRSARRFAVTSSEVMAAFYFWVGVVALVVVCGEKVWKLGVGSRKAEREGTVGDFIKILRIRRWRKKERRKKGTA